MTLLGGRAFPFECFDRCRSDACLLLGCRQVAPANTSALPPSEIEREARDLLDRNVSRQVRRRHARKGW